MFKIEDPQSFLQKILRDLQFTITKDPKCAKMEEALQGFIPAERNRPRKFGDIEVWLDTKRYKVQVEIDFRKVSIDILLFQNIE